MTLLAELLRRPDFVFGNLFFCHNSIVYFYEEKLAEQQNHNRSPYCLLCREGVGQPPSFDGRTQSKQGDQVL